MSQAWPSEEVAHSQLYFIRVVQSQEQNIFRAVKPSWVAVFFHLRRGKFFKACIKDIIRTAKIIRYKTKKLLVSLKLRELCCIACSDTYIILTTGNFSFIEVHTYERGKNEYKIDVKKTEALFCTEWNLVCSDYTVVLSFIIPWGKPRFPVL